MVCAPVRRNNPRALARGLSTVQAHKPCSISLVQRYSVYTLHITEEYLVFKDWVHVSGDCGIQAGLVSVSSLVKDGLSSIQKVFVSIIMANYSMLLSKAHEYMFVSKHFQNGIYSKKELFT